MRRARILWVSRWVSIAILIGLVGISISSVVALERQHRQAVTASHAELETLQDAGRLHQLLYQKGFVAEFFLTGDERWLEELGKERAPFEAWLTKVAREVRSDRTHEAIDALRVEYVAYDRERDRAIRLFRSGDREAAVLLLTDNRTRAARLRDLASSIIEDRRSEVSDQVEQANTIFWYGLLVLASLAGAVVTAVALLGHLLARRIGRPLYELVLRTEASTGTRFEVHAEDEVAAISAHVARLAAEVETSSRALIEERARAAQAEKMSALGEMAAAIAHEVLNPLAGIKVALQLLARMEPSPGVQETVGAVDREIARVDRIARRLIAFARPLQPVLRSCDPAVLIPRVLDAVRVDSAAKGVSLGFDLANTASLNVDPDLLEQVLVNLTMNACQALAGAGRVIVRVRSSERWKTIEVIDDGPGVAPEIASSLFTPFVTNRPDGHGLGLALSQSIAIAHGGRIEARSNAPERGTTFVVYLPEAA